VDEEGNLDFRPDRYGRDAPLVAALARGTAVASKPMAAEEPGLIDPAVDPDDLAP
jgi:hypothetical protein